MRWAVAALGLTLARGSVINLTCYVPGGEEGHTHIFDNFSSPFHGNTASDGPSYVAGKLSEGLQSPSLVALVGLALLTVVGLALRTPSGRGVSERLLSPARPSDSPEGETTGPVWSRPIPARWLAAVAIVGLLALALSGTYVYYPSPDDVLEEMKIVRADALSAVNSGSSGLALRHLLQWESLAGKLPVGTILRRGGLDGDMRRDAQELREGIEDLRGALERGVKQEDTKVLADAVQKAYERCRTAYREPRPD